MRPLLALSTREDITRRSAADAMIKHFRLSDADATELIPSGGSTYVANRAGWAMTFLTKGGLISKVAPSTYRVTPHGKKFLKEHPSRITEKDLKKIPGWEESWQKGNRKRKGNSVSARVSGNTPLEVIDSAVETINADVRSRLLEEILKQSPTFFEKLVLDVLVAMGYGGSRQDAALHVGKTNDEGVDGRINQDTLGLDQILIQAKRYGPDNKIDRNTIQAFVGSLSGKGVSKGVFITTSSFAFTAQEFVERGLNTKVILIDGNRLLDLMIMYKVGVNKERTIELLNVDQNYFDEE